MSTYRERRLAKAARLRDWSASNAAKADNRSAAADATASAIPFGQPILVGHHSERRHRRDLERIHANMSASVQLSEKAASQAARADEIEAQAAGAIYSDDPDAIPALTAKIAHLEERREAMKAANAEYRKAHREQLKAMSRYEAHQAVPYPSWAITNIGGNISRCRDRLARLQREAEHGPTDRIISARFDSDCATCGARLHRGDTIRYNRAQSARCYPQCAVTK